MPIGAAPLRAAAEPCHLCGCAGGRNGQILDREWCLLPMGTGSSAIDDRRTISLESKDIRIMRRNPLMPSHRSAGAVGYVGRPAPVELGPSTRTLHLSEGRTLAVRLWPGRGEPIVLLHGLLDCGEGWDTLARSTTRPCVAFDLPGFGGSDLPTRPRISAYAEDVLAGIEQLGLKRYALVGHSLGGAVATAVAERAGNAVRSLLLLAPAGFGRVGFAEAAAIPVVRDLTDALLPALLASPRVVTAAYKVFVANGAAPDSGTLTRVRARHGCCVRGARDATRAVVAAGLSSRAFHRRRVGYRGPARVVWGDRDRLVSPSHAAGVRRALPQVEVEIWAGMGHHPQRERAARLDDVVKRSCPDSRAEGPRGALLALAA